MVRLARSVTVSVSWFKVGFSMRSLFVQVEAGWLGGCKWL